MVEFGIGPGAPAHPVSGPAAERPGVRRHASDSMTQDDDHSVRLPDSLDHDKLAEAALGLLALTLHDRRVWKALDWDLMNLLFQKGWVCDPVSKAKSVVLTEEGEVLATQFLIKHFSNKPSGHAQ
jgi:hypothetical protein